MTDLMRWSAEDDARLRAIVTHRTGKGERYWYEVSLGFPGRSWIAIRSRAFLFRQIDAKARKAALARPTVAMPSQEFDRQRPADLPLPLSLTALICGDPIPGRSALDRRMAGAA